MEVIIFIAFLFLFSCIIIYFPFFKKCGLSKVNLVSLFLLKIGAGFAYAFFYKLPKYYAGSDTWRFYKQSLLEKKWLLTEPIAFVKDLFVYGYHTSGSLFNGENSYWNDLKSNVPIKLMALMNVVTDDSYYTNIILFNFLFFIGLVALFKLFLHYFPNKKWFIIVGVFLLPSPLFWCSGIHKDGLVLSALGALLYLFHKILKIQFSAKKIFYILLCSLVLFSLRNYMFFALIPALACWYIAAKIPNRSMSIFIISYGAILLLCILLVSLQNTFNPFNILAEKQHEFLLLGGNSTVIKFQLHPTLKGMLSYFPYAMDMAFLRPHLTEINNPAYLPAIVETVLLFVVMLSSIISKNQDVKSRAMTLFMIFFSLSILLICGFTIPLTGAVVRYRSVILPLLITPFLCTQTLFRFGKKI